MQICSVDLHSATGADSAGSFAMSVVVPDVAVELGDANVAGEEVPLPPHDGATVGSVLHDAATAAGAAVHGAADAAHSVADAVKHTVQHAVHGSTEHAEPPDDDVEVPQPPQEDATEHSLAHDAAAAVGGAAHSAADAAQGAIDAVKHIVHNAVHGSASDVDSQADGHNDEHKPDFSVEDEHAAKPQQLEGEFEPVKGQNMWQKFMSQVRLTTYSKSFNQTETRQC